MANGAPIDAVTGAVRTGPLGEECTIYPAILIEPGEKYRVSESVVIQRYSAHYACSCPAWRFHAEKDVRLRSCEHLAEVLGEAYEEARMELVRRVAHVAMASEYAVQAAGKRSSSPPALGPALLARQSLDAPEEAAYVGADDAKPFEWPACAAARECGARYHIHRRARRDACHWPPGPPRAPAAGQYVACAERRCAAAYWRCTRSDRLVDQRKARRRTCAVGRAAALVAPRKRVERASVVPRAAPP